jgi:hypothetical protein
VGGPKPEEFHKIGANVHDNLIAYNKSTAFYYSTFCKMNKARVVSDVILSNDFPITDSRFHSGLFAFLILAPIGLSASFF